MRIREVGIFWENTFSKEIERVSNLIPEELLEPIYVHFNKLSDRQELQLNLRIGSSRGRVDAEVSIGDRFHEFIFAVMHNGEKYEHVLISARGNIL